LYRGFKVADEVNKVTRSQRRKVARKAARAIQAVLADIFRIDPDGTPVCDCCIAFGLDDPPRGCYIREHEGEVPRKGFCTLFDKKPGLGQWGGGGVLVHALVLGEHSGTDIVTD